MYARIRKQQKIQQAVVLAVKPGELMPGDVPAEDVRDSYREAIPQLVDRSTQCFMCSRIYFGRDLRRCPHCGSDSVASYTMDEFSHFVRNSTASLFDVPALRQAGTQFRGHLAE